jgi:hypothetical protein
MQLLLIYYVLIKKTCEIEKINCGILGHIQTYYGYYETTLNGSLHIHVLLWNVNAPNPNELVQKRRNDKKIKTNY